MGERGGGGAGQFWIGDLRVGGQGNFGLEILGCRGSRAILHRRFKGWRGSKAILGWRFKGVGVWVGEFWIGDLRVGGAGAGQFWIGDLRVGGGGGASTAPLYRRGKGGGG